MANKAIMRFQKIKGDSVSAYERHQTQRDKLKNREHPELEDKNFTIKRFENETMLQTVRRLQKEQQKRTGRKVRKDATVIVEFVLTFSPEMTDKIDMDKWIKANVDWLSSTFGKENLIRLDYNADEKTPHLHCFITPLDKNCNFNFRKHVDHISKLVHMQDDYAKAMAPFGLTRGESRWTEFQDGELKAKKGIVRHIQLNAYRQGLIKEIQTLQKQLDHYTDLTDDIKTAQSELSELESQIMNREAKLNGAKKELNRISTTIEELKNNKSLIEQDIAKEREKRAVLSNLNEALDNEIKQRKEHIADEIWRDDNEPTPSRDTHNLDTHGDDVLGL